MIKHDLCRKRTGADKMSIFWKLMQLLLMVLLIIFGGMVGYQYLGIVGVVLGAIIGFICSFVYLAALKGITITELKDAWNKDKN